MITPLKIKVIEINLNEEMYANLKAKHNYCIDSLKRKAISC